MYLKSRLLGGVVLGTLLTSAALAQVGPAPGIQITNPFPLLRDGINSVLPDLRENNKITPHLPTNAALAAASTTLYPSGVWRDDYATGNGAPPLFFTPLAGTCAANSLTNDGGSCVNETGGNSWKAITASPVYAKSYGMKCDGSTNDTAALQAAVNAAQRLAYPASSNGGGVLYLPPGFCILPNGGITITTGVMIAGAGVGSGSGAGNSGGSVLRMSSTTANMFTVTSDDAVAFDNFTIDAPGITKTAGAGISLTGSSGSTANLNSHISRMSIRNMWDGIKLINAYTWKIHDNFIQDYQNDGILLTASATFPDGSGGGQLLSGNSMWDLNLGTSNAAVEIQGGGDVEVIGNKMLGGNYGLLLNATVGPTGTLLVSANSFEENKTCAIQMSQAVSGVEYANVAVTSNELSNLGGAPSGKAFCIGTGTPTTAPKWLRNVTMTGNVVNDVVNASVALFDIADGDNVTLQGNTINNNGTAGPVAIQVGSGASNVVEAGNVAAGVPTGKYGTINGTALVGWQTTGTLKVNRNVASLQNMIDLDNADVGGSGGQIRFLQNGAVVNQIKSYYSGGWKFALGYNTGDALVIDDANRFTGIFVSKGYTVSGLPAGVAGARAHVTDQLTACAAIGVALTGGGVVTCPVFYNGSAWVGG